MEVRAAKTGMAFVDFKTESEATDALNGLQGFKLTLQNEMKLTFANK